VDTSKEKNAGEKAGKGDKIMISRINLNSILVIFYWNLFKCKNSNKN
jgi:hypothetical protein